MAESNNTKNNKRGTFVDNLNKFSFECNMTRADRLPANLRAGVPAEQNRKITKGRGRASGGRGIGE